MRMRLEFKTIALAAIVVTLGLPSMMACSKVAGVMAMFTFKQANQAYQSGDYTRAARLYEETVQSDPNLVQVYFFLGNSYDNLYKPDSDDPANKELINKAVLNYQLAADKLTDSPEDVKLKRLALQYLSACFAAEKLDDPVRTEPVVQRMIQLDPGEPSNYFALANIYEGAGVYDEAERILLAAKTAKKDDPAVYMQLAGYYNRQGEFEKTIAALEERAVIDAKNPEAFFTIATYYWDEAYRDLRLNDPEKKAYVEKGLEAIERSLQIKADYYEALIYKNLLFRLQANLEKDPAKQQALIKAADQLRDHAQDLKAKKATGVGD